MREIIQITEIIVYPNEANFTIPFENSRSVEELQKALLNGFEIIHAIPFSTSLSAGIKYILKKEKQA